MPQATEISSERIAAFLLKAAREAKTRTRWVRTDERYERQLQQFVERALSHGAFVEAFADSATAFIDIGARKSLTGRNSGSASSALRRSAERCQLFVRLA